MKRLAILTAVLLIAVVGSAFAQRTFGSLYYNGTVVRTFVPPAAIPWEGVDPIYVIVDGVSEQLNITAVAPTNPDYHGGRWAVHVVTWNTTPYLLLSSAEVHAAAAAGDLTITRTPENDVLCPVQP